MPTSLNTGTPPIKPQDDMQTSPNKLKMLCLHGYLQNADVFRSRMGSTRKALKSRCEFVFVDAPHLVDAATQKQLTGDNGVVDNARTWWRWTDSQPGTRPSGAMHYQGWETSLHVLTEALEQHAPIAGIVAFSQGSAAASLLIAHLQATQSPLLVHLQTAVLVSGFVPHDPQYAAQLQANPLRVRSLHVMGERDTLVPRVRGEQLLQAWSGAEVYVHDGGHMVPTCSGAWKQRLVGFVDSQVAASKV